MDRARVDAHRAEFEGILNDRLPFGPWTAESILEESFASQALFDTENLTHLEALESRPPFIIGRKGSGKTAFVNSPSTHLGALTLELRTSQCFSHINQVLSHWKTLGFTTYLSHVRGLWRTAIWHAIFAELATKHDAPLPQLRKYLDGLAPRPRQRPMHIFSRFCAEMNSLVSEQDQALAFDSEEFTSGDVHYLSVRDEAVDYLATRSRDFLVFLDSMEDFHKVVEIPNEAMQGLLALAGERSRGSVPFTMRIAMPAELYHAVRDMSYNTNKDFAGSVILHWSASDLIRIAAHRFALFAYLNHPDCLVERGFNHFDPGDAESADRLFRTSLPGEVTSGLGGTEEALAYVLRHTQLLPRHFLILLNRIWNVSRSEKRPGLEMSASAVKKAVHEAEGGIVDEICKAYEPVHPGAKRICSRLIPHMNFVESDSSLHRAYNRHAREKGGISFPEAKDLLIEIGALGRWIGETERYIEAEFEYTMPNRLGPADDEQLVLHPLFAGVFGSRESQPNGSPGSRPVYPFGCDPSGPDVRVDRRV